MEESQNLSWRASLAKSNINILNMVWSEGDSVVDVFFEFMYHPKLGQTKWCKTWTQVTGEVVDLDTDDRDNAVQCAVTGYDIARCLKKEALALRKELEG